jgi:tetratricopeptide (TPR) repeat protein
VIYLLDGTVMVVEKVWQEGDQIKYQTSGGVQTLPAKVVRQIQKESLSRATGGSQKWSFGVEVDGKGTRTSTSAGRSSASGATAFSNEALTRLRENLNADPSDIQAKLELIRALNLFASLQVTQGDLSGALASLEEALNLDRRNPVILANIAAIHLRLGNYRAAEDLLLTCLEIDKKNQQIYYLLGEAYYGQEKISQAISQWTAGLQLGPHPEMSRRLDRARQEAGVHDGLDELQSAHFILRYDRKVSDYQLGQQILITLERLYGQLTSDLTSQPPSTVAVILYPDQTYFDITGAANWSGAVFDGKIRVPTKGLIAVTPELTAILMHELTHSFIASLPGRGCPSWFNEGLAQLQEGKSAANYKKALAVLREQNQLMALKELRGSFMGLSPAGAEVAYAESLSAVEYFVAHFGRPAIRNVLDLMAQNYNFENAFKTALRQSVSDFETDWQRNLTQ